MEEEIKQRENQVLNFLKNKLHLSNKYTLTLIGILLFAFIIRLYYFIQTYDQTVWWDAAEHLSKGLDIAGKLTFEPLWGYHNDIGSPLLWAAFFKLGLGEIAIRIFIFFMSMLGVFMTYLVGKEIVEKKAALIATACMSFFYLHLFYSMRPLSGLLTSSLWLVAIYFFWKGYVKKEHPAYLYLSAAFAAISFWIYYSIGLLFPTLLIFLLITDRFRFLRAKHLYGAAVLAFTIILPKMIFNMIHIGRPISRTKSLAANSSVVVESKISYLFQYIAYMPSYLKVPLLIVFIIGLIYILMKIILGLDYIIKSKYPEGRSYLFLILWIIPIFFGFSWHAFVGSGHFEPRYLMPIFPAVFLIAGVALSKLYDYIRKFNKYLAPAVIILIVVLGGVFQLAHAHNLIMSKKDSYKEIKEAALWMRENSEPDDLIIGLSQPQLNYYARREATFSYKPDLTTSIRNQTEVVNNVILERQPKFLMLSMYEQHAQRGLAWVDPWVKKNNESIVPVKVFTMNYRGEKVPAVIIYEFKDYDFNE